MGMLHNARMRHLLPFLALQIMKQRSRQTAHEAPLGEALQQIQKKITGTVGQLRWLKRF